MLRVIGRIALRVVRGDLRGSNARHFPHHNLLKFRHETRDKAEVHGAPDQVDARFPDQAHAL
jgi:hypothetical protein